MDRFPSKSPESKSIPPDYPNDPIGLLRSELSRIESELQFNGKPYPDSLVKFPWELTGRGFFPGGDGLWRDPTPSALVKPSTFPFPFKGIMFVGQDFGSVEKYPPITRPWELDNVATWKFLVERIKQSGIPGGNSFFTNALLGLRKEGSTVGQNQCINIPKYITMCRNFLIHQIKVQDPNLIVFFQSLDQDVYTPLLSNISTIDRNPSIKTAVCCGCKRVVLITQHPSSDHGVISRYPDKFHSRCNDLAASWNHSKAL